MTAPLDALARFRATLANLQREKDYRERSRIRDVRDKLWFELRDAGFTREQLLTIHDEEKARYGAEQRAQLGALHAKYPVRQ